MAEDLAIICVTRDDPRQVAAALADVAALASEVLLAVDHRVDPATLGPYGAICDTVHVFDARPHGVEVVRNWLFDRTDAEWALVLDGDEVVSAELLAVLPSMLAADVVQHALARRWCFPTIATWLGEAPWWPDFQVRLLRRTPWRARRFGVLPHDGAQVGAPPLAYQLAPLYHLDTALTSHATRIRKARRYEAMFPGLVGPAGDPLNSTYYAPEEHTSLPLRPTPPDERERLAAVLAATARPASGTAPAVEPIDPAELAARMPRVPMGDGAYRVAIEAVDQDARIRPGTASSLFVLVTNLGTETLTGGGVGDVDVALSYRLLDGHGQVVVADGPRTRLPAPLRPGERCVARVLVEAPATTGPHVVRIDLVHDGVRWFDAAVDLPLWVGDRWSRLVAGTPRMP
jgi:hypothetical protein